MRRPQLPRANNSKTWYTTDEEEERSLPYEPTPVVLSLGSTAPHASCGYIILFGSGYAGLGKTTFLVREPRTSFASIRQIGVFENRPEILIKLAW